ncbi:hypothetical protein N7455_001758 [Penicillium solitum]|uniref:uncharacterized protein n=1 Tax=Penicillium brevicompactum TaxID=5074 RepID=UPI002540806C|nr:uncharacterized protein N7506_003885 [Penicillium brevicompactum]KAJ5344061.1 hypothetical protein N7506_003885 [Penicillium brevicompactum]KAJ5695336.1 hypothetical protein N7536_005748 [Penicillium majusculum]KAJ5878293.1 hypothetical protein N7455_001758 [Penicillium solitum]KAJ5957289.1 hypothetical protein N7501_011568 [Penicillium viridicatum]
MATHNQQGYKKNDEHLSHIAAPHAQQHTSDACLPVVSVRDNSLTIMSSHLLSSNCVARHLVAHSLEQMVSETKM